MTTNRCSSRWGWTLAARPQLSPPPPQPPHPPTSHRRPGKTELEKQMRFQIWIFALIRPFNNVRFYHSFIPIIVRCLLDKCKKCYINSSLFFHHFAAIGKEDLLFNCFALWVSLLIVFRLLIWPFSLISVELLIYFKLSRVIDFTLSVLSTLIVFHVL
jgi:hypothetical protein